MADRLREDSLLFSIKSLQKLEQERVEHEHLEHERRIAEQHQRRVVEEQRYREAETRRQNSEAARVQAERLHRAEEAARVEALKLAELERIRMESKLRADLALAAADAEHQVRIERIRSETKRKADRFAAIAGVTLALLSVSGGLGLYYAKLLPDQATQLAQLRAQLGGERDRAGGLERDLDKVKTELHAEQAESVKLRKARDVAEARLREAERSTPATKPRGQAGGSGPRGDSGPGGAKSPPAARCTGSDFDPMNGCLK